MGISANHERELAIRARGGNRAAMAELLKAHDGWFHRHAFKYAGNGDRAQDLLQIIRLAALESVPTFDPDRGVRFLTYANYGIRQAINAFRNDNLIRLPVNPAQLKAGTVQKAACAKSMTSLDFAGVDGEGERPDPLEQQTEADPSAAPEYADDLEELGKALDLMDDRDRFILLERAAGYTLVEVAEDLGLTKEGLRQAEKRALRKLRELMAVA